MKLNTLVTKCTNTLTFNFAHIVYPRPSLHVVIISMRLHSFKVVDKEYTLSENDKNNQNKSKQRIIYFEILSNIE